MYPTQCTANMAEFTLLVIVMWPEVHSIMAGYKPLTAIHKDIILVTIYVTWLFMLSHCVFYRGLQILISHLKHAHISSELTNFYKYLCKFILPARRKSPSQLVKFSSTARIDILYFTYVIKRRLWNSCYTHLRYT